MPKADEIFVLRDFLGVNRRDGGERASDREFLTIQNFFRKEKGLLYKRFGSTYDLAAADVPGCDRITSLHRHPVYPCPKAILYHCTPTSTPITHPGATGLTIAEVVTGVGTIFDAAPAASRVVHLCYSYIGMGVESSWDTRTRPLFIPAGASDINAWDQLGLQTFVLALATNELDVSHPAAFPADVRAVNVFMSIGDPTDGANRRQLVYVGTLQSPADTLRINQSIGVAATRTDVFTDSNFQVEARYEAGGEFPPGQYYVALAWVSDGEPQPSLINLVSSFSVFSRLSNAKIVTINNQANSIGISHWEAGAVSANGATHVYAFVGVKDSQSGIMTHVGSFRVQAAAKITGSIDTLVVTQAPYNKNAQSNMGSGGVNGGFINVPHQNNDVLGIRHGFIVKKDSDRPVLVSEVFPSRSDFSFLANTVGALEPFYLLIRTENDRLANNAAATPNSNVVIPSQVYFQGASYFANGRNFLYIDGIGAGRMTAKNTCVIPDNPILLFVSKSQLITVTAEDKNVLLGSNALEANNFSDGGTGAAFRFAILGDPFEGKITAASVFAFTTGTDGPRSFIVSFKKGSCWTLTDIPDATAGINAQADQLSGSVGTIAPRTIVQTKLGLLFLGSDGDIYMIRGSGEPLPIGSRVKEIFKHLVENETLMKMCTAVLHGNFYKISYPGSSASTYADTQIWADLRTEDGAGIQWDGPHVGVNIGCQLVLDRDEDDGSRIAGLSSAAGAALLDDESTYQDLGVNVESILEWTRRRFRSEFNFKKFRGLFLEAFYDTTDAQSVKVEGFSDAEYALIEKQLSLGDAVSGEPLWRRHVMYFVDDNLIGSDFKFRITHNDNTQFTLAAIGVPFKPERRLAI